MAEAKAPSKTATKQKRHPFKAFKSEVRQLKHPGGKELFKLTGMIICVSAVVAACCSLISYGTDALVNVILQIVS